MGKLNDRVAIVTGAARGQGAATANVFAAEGARVVLVDVLPEEGEAMARAIGPAARYRNLDVSDESGWKDLVAETVRDWARVDILVNNAAINHLATIDGLERRDFQRVLDVNLLGPWLGIKAVTPVMAKAGKGAIVNICSTSALIGQNGLACYTASKWALRGLTKTAAMELAPKGIRVNGVYPGGVNTKMGNIMDAPVEVLNKHFKGQPIPRIGEPEEIAKASLYLVSDDASYVCGAELAVDGGMILGSYSEFLPGAPVR